MFNLSHLGERVYSKGSLKNNEGGFELILSNRIDTGTLAGFKSLNLDGSEIQPGSIMIQTPQGTWPATQVGYANPLTLQIGEDVRLLVHGSSLSPGLHHIVITLTVLEIGRVQLKISDVVDGQAAQ